MLIPEQKQSLPNLLRKISIKLNSLFFQRLILLEQQKLDYKNVRHYDLQCEGIQILVSFFKTKQQYLLFKGLTSIREHPNLAQENGAQPYSKVNGTTRTTFLNTTFTASQSSPFKENFCPTIRSLRSQKASSLHSKSQLNKTSTNLQLLLDRVKLANSRQQPTYSFREEPKSVIHRQPQQSLRENYENYNQNYSNTHKTDQKGVNYNKYCKSQMMSAKNSRRQFIMGKFSQIQNQLHELNCRKEVKKPQISKQILSQINSIRHRLQLKL